MNGIELLMKSMGVDPKEIVSNVEKFGALLLALNEKLDRQEKLLNTIIQRMGRNDYE